VSLTGDPVTRLQVWGTAMSERDNHNDSQDESRDRVWAAAWADALRGMSLGWDLAVPICGGGVVGHLLDRYLHTGYVTTVGLLFLGVAVGFYNVGRRIQQEIARDRFAAEDEDDGI
jgi:F0F1-type ATP synthase assembly protein I